MLCAVCSFGLCTTIEPGKTHISNVTNGCAAVYSLQHHIIILTWLLLYSHDCMKQLSKGRLIHVLPLLLLLLIAQDSILCCAWSSEQWHAHQDKWCKYCECIILSLILLTRTLARKGATLLLK
jgi:hypothetical protein